MSTKIQKWGNSLGVRIPKPLADLLGVKEGDTVEMDVDANKLMLKKKVSIPSLEEMLEGVTPQNVHKEADWNEPRDEEIW